MKAPRIHSKSPSSQFKTLKSDLQDCSLQPLSIKGVEKFLERKCNHFNKQRQGRRKVFQKKDLSILKDVDQNRFPAKWPIANSEGRQFQFTP